MALNIYTSNRMEHLVGALAGVVAEPLPSPFTREIIVIQSKGMQRWLSMELAKRFGIWANCDFPFPNDMVWRLFRHVFPEVPERSRFAPEVLTWRIMTLLPAMLSREEFGQLRHYLDGDRDGLKLYQLAGKVADTFDQYTMFRPRMLLEWETGKGTDWQPVLWRELVGSRTEMHRGRMKEEFCRRLHSGAEYEGFPERISIFGTSYLPKYHLDIVAAVAQATEVNLFLLSPTREYWADIASPRETAFMTAEQRALRVEGNPLLASLGKIGREFSDMVIDIGETASAQEDLYADPGHGTLLRSLQSDILNLADGSASGTMALDGSISLHSCHSPMREVEILHDNLLSLFDREPGLLPRDVVVMTPDIERYAPYISAVFDSCQDPSRTIPFSIADRSISRESIVTATFLKLLELPGSRLTVPRMLDILEAPPVSRRFGLDPAGLEAIRRWVKDTGIRWGMNEQERIDLGLPAYREHSWEAGLERLVTGYAMTLEEEATFNGILPVEGVEGSGAAVLGKLLDFVQAVHRLKERLGGQHALSQWRIILREIMEAFIPVDDQTAAEVETVMEVLDTLAELEDSANFTGTVGPAVVRSWLSSFLEKKDRGFGFMTGGITFCAMLPMRSIPFRVVALIGMNDGVFPRQGRAPGFDLISRNPSRGDRSLRDEDRYLFLESVLSARDCLYISYVGQSIRDNSEIPPSVVVSELLDVIRKRVERVGKDQCDHLVTRHRLQAFSSAYYTESSPLFSYSSENCDALREKREDPAPPPPFISVPVPVGKDECREVSLADLLRFFANPSRFLLEKRLGIRLENGAEPLEEREPFDLQGLQEYLLYQELLERELQGKNIEEALPVFRSRGVVPPALHGEAVVAEAVREVRVFAGKVREQLGESLPLAPLECTVDLHGVRLTGTIAGIRPDRLLRYRYARMKAKDRFSAWLEHLVLNLVAQEGYPVRTTLLMEDGVKRFRPVADPDIILEKVMGLYVRGLCQPLRFFPESAMEYAHKLEWNLERARKKWTGGEFSKGEGEDPYYRKCFGDKAPFTSDFEEIARDLLTPMMEHQE